MTIFPLKKRPLFHVKKYAFREFPEFSYFILHAPEKSILKKFHFFDQKKSRKKMKNRQNHTFSVHFEKLKKWRFLTIFDDFFFCTKKHVFCTFSHFLKKTRFLTLLFFALLYLRPVDRGRWKIFKKNEKRVKKWSKTVKKGPKTVFFGKKRVF